MPSGLPARGALVCTLFFGVAIAHADRRSVAVIDMSGTDAKTTQLARDLNPVLLGHPQLQPLADPSLAAELLGRFQDDDRGTIRDAQGALETAEEYLSRYEFATARVGVERAQAALRTVIPSAAPGAMRLYAKLAFVHGQALLGTRQAADAPRAFALASRFDPTFVPDAARYLPDVVQAYEAAKRKWTGTGTITIAGTGRLWVDGVENRDAPADLELEAGPHVIWLTGDERVTAAQELFVEANQKAKLVFTDEPATLLTKVRRARSDLAYGDSTTRASAIKRLVALLGRDGPVRDAVLLTAANGQIIYQTWNANPGAKKPGFSALTEYKGMTPADILAELAPPEKKDVVADKGFDKPVVDTRRWYERRTWQATMAVTTIALIVTGYYIYKGLTDDDFTVFTDVGEATARSPLEVRW